jgi:hypothetical protein
MSDIKLGLTSLSDIKFGNNQISSVYLGTNLVWSNFSYILDLYPSAHHAYSLRKLRSAYTGKCLRVRRTTSTPSVTTTTVDVSFNSSNTISLDSAITYVSGTATTATNLGQFCASILNGYSNPDLVNINQNIFVVTWFDQSGNGKNPTQATAGNQPRLINTGNLELSEGKVAVRFTRTSSTRLTIADTTANIDNMSSYFVGQYVTTGGTQNAYALSATNRFYLPTSNSVNISAGYAGTPNAIVLQAVNINRNLYELLAPSPNNSSVVEAFANGVSKGTVAISSGPSFAIWLGHAANVNHFDGYIQEVIGWQTNANRIGKETNINSYWQIY